MAVSLVPAHARWAFKAGATALAQYQFCALDSTGRLIVPTGFTFAVVLDDAPSLAAATTLGTESAGGAQSGGYTVNRYYGCVLPLGVIQKVITGGDLTPGIAIKTDTNGHAVASSSTSDVVLGWTIQASKSGDVAPMMLVSSIHP